MAWSGRQAPDAKGIFDPVRIVNKAIFQSSNLSGCGEASHPRAGAFAQRVEQIIAIDGSYRDRLTRLSWSKKRWIGAGPGREITIMKGGSSRFGENWVAVFIENDKGVLSVRGATAEDAIEQALTLLEPSKKRT